MRFIQVGHRTGVEQRDGILFSTRFGYMFPKEADHLDTIVPPSPTITAQLDALGLAMAMPDRSPLRDSSIPAVHTYLGQFIDHDITARTDRELPDVTEIDGPVVARREPSHIAQELRNGRRPNLDLDSLYGGGPGLAPHAFTLAQAGRFSRYRGPIGTEPVDPSRGLYDPQLRLRVVSLVDPKSGATYLDLPRDGLGHSRGRAIIADPRNDENVIIGQLHAAFLAFHDALHDDRPAGLDAHHAATFVRTRQLVRWCYQYVVLNDYLPTVCDPAVAADVLASGPRYLGSFTDDPGVFVPIEFSVAAFRFGHSLIRPRYLLRHGEHDVRSLLFPELGGALGTTGVLQFEFAVDWDHMVGPRAQRARRIDPRISAGLADLPEETGPVLGHLAKRNLRRGFNLSLPSGQAVAWRMGLFPLQGTELFPPGRDPQSLAIVDALCRLGPHGIALPNQPRPPGAGRSKPLWHRTPLWYYVLREAQLQQDGQRLGEVGSRIVAETLVHLVQRDPSSYLNQVDPAIRADGIVVRARRKTRTIRCIDDILRVAGVLP